MRLLATILAALALADADRGKIMLRSILVLALLFAGCTAPVWRYTWTPTDDLKHVDRVCRLEASRDITVPLVGLMAVSVPRTLYKDCMERHGFVKLNAEMIHHPIEPDYDHGVYRLSSPYPCRVNQTCLYWVGGSVNPSTRACSGRSH